MRLGRMGRLILWGCFSSVMVFLVVPLIIVVAVSFSPDIFMIFPPKGLSLKWYLEFLSSSEWREAIRNSLVIACGTALLSTSIALPMAFVLHRCRVPLAGVIRTLGLLPFLLPPVIIGVAFMAFFYSIGYAGRPINVIVAHSIFYTTLPLMLISLGMESVSRQLEEAAMNLGATQWRVFRTVTIPLIKNDVFAGILFAFILSLNEYFIAFLVAGFTVTTLPIQIFSSLRYSYSPTIAAVSVFFIILTCGMVLAIERLTGGLWE
jgi:ABC-type spermidine/putrescine transport system permease subunit II